MQRLFYRFIGIIVATTAITLVSSVPSQAADWPAIYRDGGNSNYTDKQPDLPYTQSYSVANYYNKPVISQNIVITSRLAGTIRYVTAYNATTGQWLWDFNLNKEIPRQPFINGDRVYFGVSTSGNVYALDLLTGQLIWRTTVPNERLTRHSPIVVGDALYVAGDSLHKLDLAGTVVWTKPYDITTPLAADNTTLFFRIHSLEMISFNTATDRENWHYFTNTTAGTAPVLAKEVIYLGLYQKIVALDKATGAELWHHDLPAHRPKVGSIAVIGDNALIGTSNGDIFRFTKAGTILWRTQYNTGDYSGNGWLSEFIVAGNQLIGRYNQQATLIMNAVDGFVLQSTALSTTGITPVAATEPALYLLKEGTLITYQPAAWHSEPTPPSSPGIDPSISPIPTASPITIPPPVTDKRRPVIIVPGILESWPVFGTWQLDPIFHLFQPLKAALEQAGYETGETLFTFPYDWHRSNEETAAILQQRIGQIKQLTGTSQVDIIAHSMGGLVARAYIQGDEYQNDVHNLITIATPHHGATKTYLTWEAGKVGDAVVDQVIEKLITYEARKAQYNRVTDYIHQAIPALQELLPIYSYLIQDNTLLQYLPCNAILYPCNPFLELLDQATARLVNRTVFLNIIATTKSINTLYRLTVQQPTESTNWQHGIPMSFRAQTEQSLTEGDETVPLSSAHIDGAQEITIEANHTEAITASIPAVLQTLTGMSSTIQAEWHAPNKVLFLEWQGINQVNILAMNGQRLTHQQPLSHIAFAANEPSPSSLFFQPEGERGIAIIPDPADRYTLTYSSFQPTASITASIISDNTVNDQIITLVGESVTIETNVSAAPSSPTSAANTNPSLATTSSADTKATDPPSVTPSASPNSSPTVSPSMAGTILEPLPDPSPKPSGDRQLVTVQSQIRGLSTALLQNANHSRPFTVVAICLTITAIGSLLLYRRKTPR